MRHVSMIRFHGPSELWGRRVTFLREQDGYQMRFWPESGTLIVNDAKPVVDGGGGEVVVHASRCDIYLKPEKAEAVVAELKAKGAPVTK